jgi:hypothetical protein
MKKEGKLLYYDDHGLFYQENTKRLKQFEILDNFILDSLEEHGTMSDRDIK